MALDPRTIADIKDRGRRIIGHGDTYDCGCHTVAGRWRVCLFHAGFDTALDLHATEAEA